jgi:hypothetical protein
VDEESAKLQCRDKATGEVDKASTEEDRVVKKAVSISEEVRRGWGRKKGGVEGKGGGGRFITPSSHGSYEFSLGSRERSQIFEKIFEKRDFKICSILFLFIEIIMRE